MFTTDNPAPAVRALLRETGICIDPDFPGEVRWLFDGNPGLRRRYQRKTGLTLDQFGEMLWSRGITATRPDVNQVCEMLETFLRPDSHDGTRKPKRARVTRAAVQGIELEAHRAKNARNKKFLCPECGRTRCNGAVSTCRVICGHCYENTGAIVFLARVDLTFSEVMAQTESAETPF